MGLLYKHFNVWVGNSGTVSSENVGNTVLGFKVGKGWIASTGAELDTIRLWRYGGEAWEELSCQQVGEDAVYSYFEAETPGFSQFAITALLEAETLLGDADNPLIGEDPNLTKVGSFEGDLFREDIPVSGNASEEEKAGVKPAKVLLSIGLLSLMFFVAYMVSRKKS